MFQVKGWGLKWNAEAFDGEGGFLPAFDRLGGGKSLYSAIENAFRAAYYSGYPTAIADGESR